ncbi:MAG: adenylate/guanylate cyclase domain-containing protein [Tabrizicola sp.]|nr:adenylate/guanylate cyclase domain-containing protein [Tabrizicola sp.]
MSDARRSPRQFLRLLANGGPSLEGIPLRVQDEIARSEEKAERLIGWVQLSLLLAFGSLYAIAPRAEGSSGIGLVPFTLAAYLVFTIFRLLLSYRSRPPGWFLVLSIVIDVSLLCVLIFSFHIQYNQPAAFYLKAPTMIYLFIFISVRALRFDPRYVLLTGLVAMAAWLVMVVYALKSDMGEMRVTRNYVEYLTSNSILIGAEIDKIIALLGVTFVLTLALYRARNVAVVAAKSSTAVQDLGQFFAPEVASTITSADAMPGEDLGVVRMAAVLFVDVRGFTNTAQKLPPETVMKVLRFYQDTAMTEIQRYGGRVDKFMGDGILATFGAVEASETFAVDGLNAATEIVNALDSITDEVSRIGWPGPFRTGVAVAAGSVTVGVVGAQGRLEFTVIGNAVNLASKLEGANKLQQTRALTDIETLRLARMQGYVADPELRAATSVPGLRQKVDLVVLA